MTHAPLSAQLKDLLTTPAERAETLSALYELTPIGHEPLRAAAAELLADPEAHATYAPLTLSTLKRLLAPAPAAPPPLTRSVGVSDALSLLDQLDALLIDIELSLPLRTDLSRPELLRRALLMEAGRAWAARAREARDDRLLAALSDASRRLGDLVLTLPEGWLDAGVAPLARDLGRLAGGTAGGEEEWLGATLDLDTLAECAPHPPLLGAMLRAVEGRAPLADAALWRALLAPRVPPEALDDAVFVAARLTRGLQRTARGVTFELAYCPPGVFMMGSDEDGAWSAEHPRHAVEMTRGLWVATTPVTRALWRAVMVKRGEKRGEERGEERSAGEERDGLPVEGVSWFDALRFCNKLSALEGLTPAYELGRGARPRVSLVPDATGYRLPTEAEWEHAAAAGGDLPYSGADRDALDEVAWHAGNAGGGARPVGERRPNAWGLHDMSGNVWEWCNDAWLRDAYKRRRDREDPLLYTEQDAPRALRGGSYENNANECRRAYRFWSFAAAELAGVGLRVVRR